MNAPKDKFSLCTLEFKAPSHFKMTSPTGRDIFIRVIDRSYFSADLNRLIEDTINCGKVHPKIERPIPHRIMQEVLAIKRVQDDPRNDSNYFKDHPLIMCPTCHGACQYTHEEGYQTHYICDDCGTHYIQAYGVLFNTLFVTP